ncbi:hypothetical protein [Natronolimnobius baerhuensis]|uniref:Uncharacterized protein n=1 Tax=Natronolimnobius baerhuensis TaxID=253108 RepID=A0A202E5W4_9EURY|nr:hypothetical protein [Natronolimnobius baerhuensis]OVE83683.1 hypothetical protein B2G88_14745 [Natronolimnobius baerhuensis]
MATHRSLSRPVRFALEAAALAILTAVLLLGGTQSGFVTPTLTWVTPVLVIAGCCSGVLFWRYSTDSEQGLFHPWLSGPTLVAGLLAVVTGGALWVAFVPPAYGTDLVYGVLALAWTAFVLSSIARF